MVNRDRTIVLLLGISAAATFAIFAILWPFGRAGDDDAERPPATLVGEIAPAVEPRVAFPRNRAPLDDLNLVETALPEDNDPGSAALQYRDGHIRRFAVRDWIDANIQLVNVSDSSAVFQTANEQVTLRMIEARLPDIQNDNIPGLPGIDINRRSNTANPAIAR